MVRYGLWWRGGRSIYQWINEREDGVDHWVDYGVQFDTLKITGSFVVAPSIGRARNDCEPNLSELDTTSDAAALLIASAYIDDNRG